MAVQHAPTVEATAAVDCWVPRDTMGDVESAVRNRVTDVEAVETAAVTDLAGVQPRATDLKVKATVWVVVEEREDPDAVRETLADGFGIMDADVVVVDPAEA